VKGMTTSCFDAADPTKVEVSPKIGCELYRTCVLLLSSDSASSLHLFTYDTTCSRGAIQIERC
jgi:hypothetical protein